jgi:hypothetical protein
MSVSLIEGFAPILSDEDRKWIADNLVRGGDKATMAAALVRSGRNPETVRREIETEASHPFVRGALQARELWVRRLAKANWVLDVLSKLDRQTDDATTIPIVERISAQDFFREFYVRNKPCLITGCLEKWPALSLWSPDYFVSRWGEREVEVQAQRESNPRFEINAERYTEKMRFSDFIAAIRSARSNDLYMMARNTDFNRQSLSDLWPDVGQLPDYLAVTDPPAGFLWLGSAGTITPAHHDLTNNCMAQVIGRKRIWLAPMTSQPHLYNYLHVFSDVDLSCIDYERFPETRNVRVIECTLEPGQILFLPVGCWHQVEALDLSATMTFTNFLLDNDFSAFYQANGEL